MGKGSQVSPILQTAKKMNQRYMLFGAGAFGQYVATRLGEENISCYIDNKKNGCYFMGKEVLSLSDALTRFPGITIIVTIKNKILLSEVQEQLHYLGVPAMTYNEFILKGIASMKIDDVAYYKRFHDELDYMLEQHQLFMIPYPWRKKYDDFKVDMAHDFDAKCYVFQCYGEKLFIPDDLYDDTVLYFRSLLIEQNNASPHRYFSEGHSVGEECIFVDVGGAEAMTSLEVLGKARHIFIFEGDPKWEKALNLTFRNYKSKVTIVSKNIGAMDSADSISIDSYFENIPGKLFFKVDIEGGEQDFLNGAEKTLQRPGTKISLCTYHNREDAMRFQEQLKQRGYQCRFSPNWIFLNEVFVKGVLYGVKEDI